MKMMKNTYTLALIIILITAILVGLKLADIIAISWLMALSPLLGATIGAGIMFIIYIVWLA